MSEQIIAKDLGDKHEAVAVDEKVVQLSTSEGPAQLVYRVLNHLDFL